MSKYAGLPDIDTEPDVYEAQTASAVRPPAPDSTGDDDDEDARGIANADIVRASLAPGAAAKHFRKAADRSSRWRPLQPLEAHLLESNGGAGMGTAARLRRLQVELEAIDKELAEQTEGGDREGAEDTPAAAGSARANDARTAAHLWAEVQRLQTQLAGRRLDGDAQALIGSLRVEGTGAVQGHGAGVENAAGSISREPTSASASALDTRLRALEGLVGHTRLEKQMQLLTQPRHLDTILHRAKMIAGELDRVAESRRRFAAADGDGAPQDALAQLDALQELQARIEPLIPLAPALVARLQTLAPLHAAASSVDARMVGLEKSADAQRAQLTELQDVLDSAASSLEENSAGVQANLAALQGRLAAVERRVGAPPVE
ncbi:hypothetical protein MSPP1_000647 [Malassezia sp. CBS 17886]|nr:hypothetical protein MSPP1_000647 [Malassezia sp. CBS 17886]